MGDHDDETAVPQGDREEKQMRWKSVLGDDIKSVKDPGKITKQRQDQTYPKLNL